MLNSGGGGGFGGTAMERLALATTTARIGQIRQAAEDWSTMATVLDDVAYQLTARVASRLAQVWVSQASEKAVERFRELSEQIRDRGRSMRNISTELTAAAHALTEAGEERARIERELWVPPMPDPPDNEVLQTTAKVASPGAWLAYREALESRRAVMAAREQEAEAAHGRLANRLSLSGDKVASEARLERFGHPTGSRTPHDSSPGLASETAGPGTYAAMNGGSVDPHGVARPPAAAHLPPGRRSPVLGVPDLGPVAKADGDMSAGIVPGPGLSSGPNPGVGVPPVRPVDETPGAAGTAGMGLATGGVGAVGGALGSVRGGSVRGTSIGSSSGGGAVGAKGPRGIPGILGTPTTAPPATSSGSTTGSVRGSNVLRPSSPGVVAGSPGVATGGVAGAGSGTPSQRYTPPRITGVPTNTAASGTAGGAGQPLSPMPAGRAGARGAPTPVGYVQPGTTSGAVGGGSTGNAPGSAANGTGGTGGTGAASGAVPGSDGLAHRRDRSHVSQSEWLEDESGVAPPVLGKPAYEAGDG